MNFINKDLFGFIIDDKTSGNGKSSIDQVSMYAIASAKKYSEDASYKKYMKKIADNSNPFISIRFKNPHQGKMDYATQEVYAYKHDNKGNLTCWVTSDPKSDAFKDSAELWNTYFIAIPYKQKINSIICSSGVEIVKVSTRTYAKIHNKRGQFDWRDNTINYPKDSTDGKNYSKVLYMIANVALGCKNPTITIDEIKLPVYNIKKDVENHCEHPTYPVTHNKTVIEIPDATNCHLDMNFYPHDELKQSRWAFADASAAINDTAPLTSLVNQTPISKETF